MKPCKEQKRTERVGIGKFFYLFSTQFFIYIGLLLIGLVYGVLILWAFLALGYSPAGWLVAGGYAVCAIALPWIKKIPGFLRWCGAALLWFCVVWYWQSIVPTPGKNYQTSVAVMPHAEFNDDGSVTVYDIRNFHYRSVDDFAIEYITETFHPDNLTSLDFIVVHWDCMDAIAHTMLTFGFADGRHLAFSFETRLAQGQSYSTLKGFFKQFELICVVAAEADVLALRTNFRHEDVYCYPTATDAIQRETIFRDLLREANTLYRTPRFYNTFSDNCTTSLLPGLKNVMPVLEFDPRLLVNGFSDAMAFEHGFLANPENMDFDEYKRRHYVNARVTPLGKNISEDYSRIMRQESLSGHVPANP